LIFGAISLSTQIEDSVVIGDGRSSVMLTPAGPPSLGFPTQIAIVAGPFQGTIIDDTVGPYERFHRGLVALYQSLTGTARLGSCEGFSLELTASRTGSIWVHVVAFGSHVPGVKVEYEFGFDQTYLPPIIESVERLFLNRRQGRVKL
jgi:hypothetical protein